jgi:hypothetical protein
MTSAKKNIHLPYDLGEKVEQYMKSCGYAKGTINMKLGNLNFLFGNYGLNKMNEMLSSPFAEIKETIKFIEETLPQGCIVSSDLHAFKIAWESLNGIELIKKRVKIS